EEGDAIWCPESMDSNFFDRLRQHGFPEIQRLSTISNRPVGLQLVPWGWSSAVVDWGQSIGAAVHPPSLEAVRTVNSRRFSHRLEQERGTALPGATIVESLSQLSAAIDRMAAGGRGWVVKAEFSHASRERYLHRGIPPDFSGASARGETERHDAPCDRDALTRWAERRLATGQALFVEPWVERIDEV